MEVSVRQLYPTDQDYISALHMALDAPSGRGGEIARPVQELLDAVRRTGAGTNLVFAAYRRRCMESAVAAFSGGGAAAIAYVPHLHYSRRIFLATQCAAGALRESAGEGNIKLLEVLVDSAAEHAARVLEGCEFRYLTRLVYMNRPISGPAADSPVAPNLSWLSYTSEREEMFLRALEASYTESLDCPELTGLRTTKEVLEGHRATGEFNPAHWWVICRDREPVGVLLLCGVPGQAALEIVYLGVAQPVRGQGVANTLILRALDTCRQQNAKDLTLAVDARNRPARALYQRWRFRPIAMRDAWIASSGGA